MSDKKSIVQELLFTVKQQRDELRLQMHLAGKEAKDEWAVLEKRVDKLNNEFSGVKDSMGDSADNVLASIQLVAEEVKNGFSNIAGSLKK